MTWLRHSARHVHATICDYLEGVLDDLDWTTTSPPLGADQVNVIRYMPPESELTAIRAGTLAITLGEELDSNEEEMGGPLARQDMPVFVDIFQSKDAYARALAQDIKDAVKGRLPNTNSWLNVQNQALDPPEDVPGWKMEFTDVEREQIYRLPIYWQSVRFTAEVYFPDEGLVPSTMSALVTPSTIGASTSA